MELATRHEGVRQEEPRLKLHLGLSRHTSAASLLEAKAKLLRLDKAKRR